MTISLKLSGTIYVTRGTGVLAVNKMEKCIQS